MEQTQMTYGLPDFFRTIYGDSVGLIYIATKTAGETYSFEQNFFEYPSELGKAVEFVEKNYKLKEVYYGPALYADSSAKKEHVAESRVVWCEFDGTVPTDLGNFPDPSIRILSSEDGHEHWYWLLDAPADGATIERINRSITYQFGADSSGWDSTQILRPPGTLNHKRNKPVSILSLELDTQYPITHFNGIPEPPPVVEVMPETLPSLAEVLNQHSIPQGPWSLFQDGVQVGSRSEGLMALGYYLAELGLTNAQVFVLLEDADRRWGKFYGRTDRNRRLMEIVTHARKKYPATTGAESAQYESIGFRSVLRLDIKLEWVLEGLLQKAGYMLVSGPSGTGKTQFCLSLAEQLALGRDFLGRKVDRGFKIGFFSLEMDTPDLKYFLETQAEAFSEDEIDKLEENVRLFPMGEPIYLSQDSEKLKIEEVIMREKLDGIIIDSLGSVTDESLSSEEAVKKLMNWNDRLRKKTGCFTIYIHHHRKATGENKKPNKLGDVFGSHYITARATTVLALWPTAASTQIEGIPLKVRLTKQPKPFKINRSPELQFSVADLDVEALGDKLASLATPMELPTSDEMFQQYNGEEKEGSHDSGSGFTI